MDKKDLINLFESGEYKQALVVPRRPGKLVVLVLNDEFAFGHYFDEHSTKDKTFFKVKTSKRDGELLFNIGHAYYRQSELSTIML